MQSKGMTKFLQFRYLYVSVIIFLCSDMLILFFPELKALYISWYLKGAIILYYAYVFVMESNKIQKIILGMLSLFFIVSQTILYASNSLDAFQCTQNSRLFVLYMFLLVLYSLFFKACNQNYSIRANPRFNRWTYGIVIAICVSMVVGLIWGIPIFKTYGAGRWGFKGLIIKSVTLSYILMLFLFFGYYQFVVKTRNSLYFLGILFCALLSGTKTVYISIILLFLYHIWHKKLFLKKNFWITNSIGIIILVAFNDFLLSKTKFVWGLFYELYQEKGFLASLTSFRSDILMNGLETYTERWNAYNYLIGGPLGINSFEMAFFDLLSFFGVIGSMLYLYYLQTFFLSRFLRTTKSAGAFIILSLGLAAFFTGQFFTNSTVILLIWFFLIIFKLNFRAESRIEEHTYGENRIT